MVDMENRRLGKMHVYVLQILFALSISVGSQSINLENAWDWLRTVGRYVIYLYLIRGSRAAISLAHQALHTRALDLRRLYRNNQKHWLVFAAAAAALLYRGERLFGDDFLLLFIAHLIYQYPDVERQARTVTYGTGMACSFFEGYLTHVLPSDGHRFVGFEENIIAFEGTQSIRFPVRRLFIVITKTMYCPPDLKLLDARLEACRISETLIDDVIQLKEKSSLEDVVKDVAGVKNRSYKNSAYKIHRAGRPPVYLAVECATPIHTLYLVLKNRTLYQELDGIDEAEVVHDFMAMLSSILRKSPECSNKCELVFFDNTDPSQSLAEILLERIRQIEPRFEEIIQEDAEARGQ